MLVSLLMQQADIFLHQLAQKSTITGVVFDISMTSAMKPASVPSLMRSPLAAAAHRRSVRGYASTIARIDSARAAISRISRDLPMPGSPPISTTPPATMPPPTW